MLIAWYSRLMDNICKPTDFERELRFFFGLKPKSIREIITTTALYNFHQLGSSSSSRLVNYASYRAQWWMHSILMRTWKHSYTGKKTIVTSNNYYVIWYLEASLFFRYFRFMLWGFLVIKRFFFSVNSRKLRCCTTICRLFASSGKCVLLSKGNNFCA